MSQTVTLQVKVNKQQAVVSLEELNKQVQSAFAQMRETVAAASAEVREFTFNPSRVLEGTDQATRGLQAVRDAAQGVMASFREVQDGSQAAGSELKTLGTQAAGTEKKLTNLATAGEAVESALGDMAGAADAANVSIDGVDEAAATAQKSVAGLGRAAANTLPKLDALSGAAFDPAGIVTGADTAVSALDRVKLAAAQVRASMSGAGGGVPPVFFGGRGGGRGGAEEEARPLTYRQGVKAGGGMAFDMAGGLAALTTIAAAVTGKLSANFDNLIQGVSGNTTMTAADESGMRSQTLRLMQTGSSSEELAQGYKHIVNMGYHGKGAAQIADFGNRFGVATHTNVEETDDFLARVMNALGHMSPDMVSRIGNVGHFAAAGSNMDIRDLEKNSARTVGLASNYIGAKGLPDVLAAYSALVQHSINPARADTQIAGMLGQIAAPSPKAEKRAAALGISADFNAVGLRNENLSGVLDKVKTAIDKLPEKERASALKDLFNNKQGGIGATFLTGAAHPTYQQALNDPRTGTKAAFEGKIDAIGPAYNAQMKQTAQAFKALSGTIQAEFIPVGAKLAPLFLAAIPVVKSFADILKTLLDGFVKLPKPLQEMVIGFGALKIISGFLPLLGGFSLLSEKTTAVVGGLGKMLFGLGGDAAAGEAGLAGVAGIMSGPFALGIAAVVAGVAALVIAWKKDFGGIREFTGGLVAQVAGFFKKNMPEIRETVHTVLSAIQTFWHDHGSRIMAIVGPLWNFIKDTITNVARLIENIVKLAMDVINGHWAAAGKDLLAIVGNLWDEIKSLFVNGVKLIGNTLMLLPSLIFDLGKRLLTAAYGLGKDVVDGLANGIKAHSADITLAMSGVGGIAISAIKAKLDSHSPSRVMHKIGQDAAQGFTDGLRQGTPQAGTAAAGMGASAISAASAAWQRYKIRHEARLSGSDAGSAREQSADKRDYQMTALSAGTAVRRAQDHADAHRFDSLFDGQEADDSRYHSKWENRLADNASYKQYLESRKKYLLEWAQAHKAWLDTHEAAAKRLEGIETRITNAMNQVSGRVQRATVANQKATVKAAKTQEKEDGTAGEVRDEMLDDMASMTESPDTYALDHEKDTIQKQYRERLEKLGLTVNGKAILGPDNPQQAADRAAADKELQLALAAITARQNDKNNQAEDKKVDWQSQTGEIGLPDALAWFQKRQAALETSGGKYTDEWYEIAGRVKELQHQITDAERQAADDEETNLRARFDALKESFDDGKTSADAYKTSLQALLQEVTTYDAAHPDAAPRLEGLRHDMTDASTYADKKEKKESGIELVGGQPFWDGLADSASEQGSRVLDALLNPKDKKKIFKSMWQDLLQSGEDALKGGLKAILKNLLTGSAGGAGGSGGGGLLGGLLGALFGGRKAAGAPAGGSPVSVPGLPFPVSLPAGFSTDPGMSAGTGGVGMASQAMGIAGLFGKGGMLGGVLGHAGIGGLFAHGGLFTSGGALGGFGAAMPWIGGGLLLNSVLGNPLGKALKGLKHLFHFAGGGRPPVGKVSIVGERGPEPFIPDAPGRILSHSDAMRALAMKVPVPVSPDAFIPHLTLPSFTPGGAAGAGAGISPQGQTTRAAAAGETEAGTVVHMHGDHIYTSEMDIERVQRKWAQGKERRRRAGTPAY